MKKFTKKFTSSPLLRSLRESDGITVSKVQELLEELVYKIRCVPYDISYWFRKTFTKSKVKIKDLHGGYQEAETKILYANFQILVDFMENEVAHMADICLGKEKIPNAKTKREKAEAYYLWEDDMTGRSAQEIKHHKQQKKTELKILNLYRWWKDERPARKDKWEDLVAWEKETGFSPFHFEDLPNGRGSRMITHDTHPLYPKYKELSNAANAQEEEWFEEDTKKLKELMEIRRYLWT